MFQRNDAYAYVHSANKIHSIRTLASPFQPEAIESSMHKVFSPELHRRAVGVGVRGLWEGLHLHPVKRSPRRGHRCL